uniref:Uncharacterized protein n=1 Tax=Aegilops tauschii subsp. strangulata TaxID=200361 RepID=A0A453S803_AEGTS
HGHGTLARLHLLSLRHPHHLPPRTANPCIISLDRAIDRPSIELATPDQIKAPPLRIAAAYMGKKPGGAGWLATVRKVFKTSPSSSPSKDPRHAKKGLGGEEQEAAEILSVEHFPATDTSPELTNEGSVGSVAGWAREGGGVEAEARRARRAMASRMARLAALRERAAGREDRAAVRIQAFYRGYLVRSVSPAKFFQMCICSNEKCIRDRQDLSLSKTIFFWAMLGARYRLTSGSKRIFVFDNIVNEALFSFG